MSDSDPTGYGESPDTVDGTAPQPDGAAPESDATLTTDDDAQREDTVRPGNEPD